MKKSKLPPIAKTLEADLKDLQSRYIPENPKTTRDFQIGERVQHGRVKKSVIEDILENGKYFVVNEQFTENIKHPLLPYRDELKIILPWTELHPYRNAAENELLPIHTDLSYTTLSYQQRDISSLLSMHYHFGVDFTPEYQRDFCWTLEDKQKLIDSIFRQVDIGKFAMHRRDYSTSTELYEIVDGKQRLSTLLEYYEDKFDYNGYKFSELSWRDQNHFDGYPAALAILSGNITRTQILDYFLRLNVAGVAQDTEHLSMVTKLLQDTKKSNTTSKHL